MMKHQVCICIIISSKKKNNNRLIINVGANSDSDKGLIKLELSLFCNNLPIFAAIKAFNCIFAILEELLVKLKRALMMRTVRTMIKGTSMRQVELMVVTTEMKKTWIEALEALITLLCKGLK